jgi:hypothetical protein
VRLTPAGGCQDQGCQMVCFQTKNPDLGKFWRALEWKMLVYFMTIWNILWPFGIIFGRLVKFVAIWYIFPILVCLAQEKPGNPGQDWAKRSRHFGSRTYVGKTSTFDFYCFAAVQS